MLFTLADFTGEHRLDTNVVTQTDYQQAIDEHELSLLRAYFDEASVQKILAAAPTNAPPAAFVRRFLRSVAVRFIFHRIRMGVQGSLPSEPTTQGYRPMPVSMGLKYDARAAALWMSKYCPYFLDEFFSVPSDTFNISPPDPVLTDVISVGDTVEVPGVGTYQVVSVTPTTVQISATLPVGQHIARVFTLKLFSKRNYLTI